MIPSKMCYRTGWGGGLAIFRRQIKTTPNAIITAEGATKVVYIFYKIFGVEAQTTR